MRAKENITNIDYRVVNERKVTYRAIFNVSIAAKRSNAHERVVHINDVPEKQFLKTNLNLNRTIENRIDRFMLKKQVVLPSSKPNARKVLQVTARTRQTYTWLRNGNNARN